MSALIPAAANETHHNKLVHSLHQHPEVEKKRPETWPDSVQQTRLKRTWGPDPLPWSPLSAAVFSRDQPRMVLGLWFCLIYDKTAAVEIETRPQTGTRNKTTETKQEKIRTENLIMRSALQPVYTLLSFFSLPSYCRGFLWMQWNVAAPRPEPNTPQRSRLPARWALGRQS